MENKNNITYSLMKKSDNNEILDLISRTSIKGDIEVTFAKEPDYLKAMSIFGKSVQVVVGKYNNKVEVLGARTLKSIYINGKVSTLGYLSDLKISPNVKKRGALKKGFDYMKTLMKDGQALLHMAIIIEDNRDGKIALTWKNKPASIPNFYDYGLLNTYFILPILPIFKFQKYKIVQGSIVLLDKIVEFLNKEGLNKQFFPIYTKNYFLNLLNFNIKDFYVALKDGEIVGVMAKWEQTPFKQVIIKKYNKKWRLIKKLSGSILPNENEPIKQFYLSFIAIKNNDNRIFEELLSFVYNKNRNYKYFSLILHSKDNLNTSLSKFFNIKYKSRLYIVEYMEDKEIERMLDNRIPYLELAGL